MTSCQIPRDIVLTNQILDIYSVEQVRSEEEMERLLSEKDSKKIKRAISTNLWYNDVHQIWVWSYLDYNVYIDITA
jgi:hypothetical protein